MLTIGLGRSHWEMTMQKDAPSKHCKDFYYPHGDVLVKMQVATYRDHIPPETMDFKLHRDILSRYSSFFWDYIENRALPDGHIQHPFLLEIAKYVTSSVTDFQNLCRFMYPSPSATGSLPHVEPGDIDKWGSTIKAAMEFGMPAIRAYIVTKLTQDEAKFTANAVSFLKWEMSLMEKDQDLVFKCYQTLAFRRTPLSPSDLRGLPDEVIHKLILVRERARSLFLDHRQLRSWMPIPPPETCTQPSVCQDSIINALIHNMTSLSPNTSTFVSIFEHLRGDYMCGPCCVQSLLDPLIEKLKLELYQYLEELNCLDGGSS
ncbi:hypothetical protein RSOL_261430 [Rhizoctonia solani AG-3 Rhs1AP]|uniref:BTB domain-containing protein n=1 Tax=Rhizoctonia solani AG-3 Rhs1AP TaxID=1086054 RepID=A0A0A1UJV7_9AGAM|nr:hypothetical protein RSOL_261430 [Rhizoctonia solani AG-3 Rhs1AP]